MPEKEKRLKFDAEAFETIADNLHNNDFEIGQIAYLLVNAGGYRYSPKNGIKVEIVERQGDGIFIVKVLERDRVLSPVKSPPDDEDILMWAEWSALISEENRAAAIEAHEEHRRLLEQDG
jgi:hypothetical protein